MRRVLQVCGAITLLAVGLPSQALAKPKPPTVPAGMASIAQYIEVIPTSTGQKQFGGAEPAAPAPAEPVTTTAPAKPVTTAAPAKPAPKKQPKKHQRPRRPEPRTPASHVLESASAPGRLSVVGDVAEGVSPLTALILSVLGVATVVALFRRPRRPPG